MKGATTTYFDFTCVFFQNLNFQGLQSVWQRFTANYNDNDTQHGKKNG